VKKLLSSSAGFVEAFAKEAMLLSQLRHENIVQFKAVCQDPMAIMLQYMYFDIEVFGGEGKLSSLNCNGIEGTFMDNIAADVAGGLLLQKWNSAQGLKMCWLAITTIVRRQLEIR